MFFSTNITDGTSNGLLSKIMPLHIQAGLFNAGFASVLFGTLGRVIGNVAVSLAEADGLEYTENNAFIPLTVVSVITVTIGAVFYNWLNPRAKKSRSSRKKKV